MQLFLLLLLLLHSLLLFILSLLTEGWVLMEFLVQHVVIRRVQNQLRVLIIYWDRWEREGSSIDLNLGLLFNRVSRLSQVQLLWVYQSGRLWWRLRTIIINLDSTERSKRVCLNAVLSTFLVLSPLLVPPLSFEIRQSRRGEVLELELSTILNVWWFFSWVKVISLPKL
jgi:hypothetical protein